MGIIESLLKRNNELDWMYDLEFGDEPSHRSYLKKTALETCINFIGRTISQSDFRIAQGNKRLYNDWHYLLNVRPNTDQSAADFWQRFIYKLIFENEVLVILTDTDDLLIADSFDREEYAVYPDVFKDVTVKDYRFKKTFSMDEVIHLDYNNDKLTSFLDGMFVDYGELFGRILETNLRNNQIRGTVEIDAVQGLDEERQKKLQKFIDKLFNTFKNSAVAIVPQLKGLQYKEVSAGASNGQSVEELSKLKKSIVDDVAKILGIPTALVHGEMADLEKSMSAYIKFCIGPLIKKIQDELNAKLFSKDEFMGGMHIDVKGIVEKNVIDHAEAVDKLVASGSFTRNEVRVIFGAERSDDPELDKFVLTKNYTKPEEVKEEK